MPARSKTIVTLRLLAVVAAGCNNNKVYDRFEHTPLAGWEKNEVITYPVPAIPRDGDYQLSLQMRTDNTFPFQSAVLIVDQAVMPLNVTHSDTLVCRMANEKGTILGSGINVYQYTFAVNTRHYNTGDSLHITLHHNMKREMLPGISDIGFKLERVSE